jgi:hypothetical protein
MVIIETNIINPFDYDLLGQGYCIPYGAKI